MSTKIGAVVDTLMREATDGEFGFWVVVDDLREGGREGGREQGQDAAALEQAALMVVRELLRRGLAVGSLRSDGSFSPWPDQDPARVADRIRREWRALGEDPSIGEICWFLPRERQA
jgi:hypothetical protein